MDRMVRLIFFAPLALLGVAVFIAAGGWIVMSLWNWLTPPLFGWRLIGFWQALGMLALCRILFGNIGLAGRGYRSDSYRRRRAERWARMSPEQRERWKSFWGPLGFTPPDDPGAAI